MIFMGGPRQVGKTTLAKQILSSSTKGDGKKGYLNWDIAKDREKILKRQFPNTPMLVLDEIHKYREWRNELKGLYDARKDQQKILVTGSARLDYYRFGGDSLQGRYHYLRLHPLSMAELGIKSKKKFHDLLTLGGFPEPFFGQSETEAKRWSREYRSRLIREDIVSLQNIQDLGHLELLTLSLPERVGSPLSINSLREDLQVSHKAVSHWIEILERFYHLFRLPPFGAPKLRAVKKEQKHYHSDWSLVPDMSKRFENLIASHLLKWVHFEQDTKARDLELRYFRDVDGREVDFVVMEDHKPMMFVECKWKNSQISPHLRYLKKRFPHVESWQISAEGNEDYLSLEDIRVAPAWVFLKKFI